MKTEALRQALDRHGFDAAFGGARRDKEKSRAKERAFSFRDERHAWNPRQQRPEMWNLYNGRVRQGRSMRVFPLSSWTELDVWAYIKAEGIPIVDLYLARHRRVIERDGTLIMVDDGRLKLRLARTRPCVRSASAPLAAFRSAAQCSPRPQRSVTSWQRSAARKCLSGRAA
jgi:sulfate adenylyltransferase subunit 2